MVECACRQIREWLDAGIEPIGISVNQSKILFYENDYIETLTALIEKYDIPGSLLTLEILEGLAADHVDELNQKISLLQNQGFRISMDDFGSGYSSLNILGNLHIDELKLDRGFLLEFPRWWKVSRLWKMRSCVWTWAVIWGRAIITAGRFRERSLTGNI